MTSVQCSTEKMTQQLFQATSCSTGGSCAAIHMQHASCQQSQCCISHPSQAAHQQRQREYSWLTRSIVKFLVRCQHCPARGLVNFLLPAICGWAATDAYGLVGCVRIVVLPVGSSVPATCCRWCAGADCGATYCFARGCCAALQAASAWQAQDHLNS